MSLLLHETLKGICVHISFFLKTTSEACQTKTLAGSTVHRQTLQTESTKLWHYLQDARSPAGFTY